MHGVPQASWRYSLSPSAGTVPEACLRLEFTDLHSDSSHHALGLSPRPRLFAPAYLMVMASASRVLLTRPGVVTSDRPQLNATRSATLSNLPSRISSLRLRQASRSRRPLSVTTGAMKDWRSSQSDSFRNEDEESLSAFVLDPSARRRLENAWTVRQDQVPVACETCQAQGMKECEWCSGSGYFVLGDKMLCEVPSRNTSCLICHGHGSVRCSDCLGTGFRARWLATVLDKKK